MKAEDKQREEEEERERAEAETRHKIDSKVEITSQ